MLTTGKIEQLIQNPISGLSGGSSEVLQILKQISNKLDLLVKAAEVQEEGFAVQVNQARLDEYMNTLAGEQALVDFVRKNRHLVEGLIYGTSDPAMTKAEFDACPASSNPQVDSLNTLKEESAMTDDLAKPPETLAALEQRIEALEKENADLKQKLEGRPTHVRVPLSAFRLDRYPDLEESDDATIIRIVNWLETEVVDGVAILVQC